MIKIKNVTHYYKSHKALNNIQCDLSHKQCIALLGENGAGKSTLMKLLVGNLQASQGEVWINGHLMYPESRARRFIGYLPESIYMYPEMRVYDYLRWISSMHDLNDLQFKTHLSWIIDRCQLQTLLMLPIAHLSKGMKQRVGLAQALIHRPKVLILDEVHSGLDYQQSQRINQILRELAQEHLVIVSTHRLHTVEEIADQALILDTGTLCAFDRLETLQATYQTKPYFKVKVLCHQVNHYLNEVIEFKKFCTDINVTVLTHNLSVLSSNATSSIQTHVLSYNCSLPFEEYTEFLKSLLQKFEVIEAYQETPHLAEVFSKLTQSNHEHLS
jgi:ABC-2 type transport system ATP-binding protein